MYSIYVIIEVSKKRKLLEESSKQLGKCIMNKYIPSIIIIEVSKEESSKKRMVQEESSKPLGKYVMNKHTPSI